MTVKRALPLALSLALAAIPASAAAPSDSAPVTATPSYADLADLADAAPLVARAKVRKLVPLDPKAHSGVTRFYVEAETEALLAGNAPIGVALTYLADLPLDAKGKPPALRKKSVLLFARAVAGRPGELQLVAPDAQIDWSEPVEATLRGILTALAAPSAPPRLLGVREALHVQGTLVGEGETQIFLDTADQSLAAITVTRVSGAAPAWSLSFSELVGDPGQVPEPDSLAWYRLACFLPSQLPPRANVSRAGEDRAAAVADYRFVLEQLGPCARTRGQS